MSKSQNDGIHRVGGVVDPSVNVAVLLAMRIYSGRFQGLEADRLQQLIASVCDDGEWNSSPEGRRSLLHMTSAALLFGLWMQRTVLPDQMRSVALSAETDARLHAVLTDGAIASLSMHAAAIPTDRSA